MRLGDVASKIGAELAGRAPDPGAIALGVRSPGGAGPGYITLGLDKERLEEAVTRGALAVIVGAEVGEIPVAQLVAANPQLAFARLIGLFHPPTAHPQGVDPGARVDPGATLGEGVCIMHNVTVGAGTDIGRGTVLYPGVYIGRDASVGEGCLIYPGVTVMDRVEIGNRVIIHAGAVLGADGFGFVFDGGRHHKIPQAGTVVIGDDVEIGAGTCIDRATTPDMATTVGAGSKLDNQVQIGHNAQVGRGVILVGQVAIGGSARVGDFVMIGGQTGIADHAEVESGAMIAACSAVMGRLEKGKYVGTPVMPQRDFFRSMSLFQKLPELNKRIGKLEEALLVEASKNKAQEG